jgi:hypothetical protein
MHDPDDLLTFAALCAMFIASVAGLISLFF